MTKRYYKKAETFKENLLVRLCEVLNVITSSNKYGLTKGWSIAQIVTAKEYNVLLKKKEAVVLDDGVIEINEG